VAVNAEPIPISGAKGSRLEIPARLGSASSRLKELLGLQEAMRREVQEREDILRRALDDGTANQKLLWHFSLVEGIPRK